MKILFAFLLLFLAVVYSYPVDEALNVDRSEIIVDEILNKNPEDIHELLRRIAEYILNDASHVIDAPIVCPPGYRVSGGACRLYPYGE